MRAVRAGQIAVATASLFLGMNARAEDRMPNPDKQDLAIVRSLSKAAGHSPDDAAKFVTFRDGRAVALSIEGETRPGKTEKVYSLDPGKIARNLFSSSKDHRLHQLPDDIGRLHFLEILRLPGHAFKVLPASVTSLKSLLVLDLTHTRLSSFPREVFDLPKLEFLGLSLADSVAIPAGLESLRTLKNLVLDLADGCKLPDLSGLAALESLTVIGAEETTFNRPFAWPPNLHSLTVTLPSYREPYMSRLKSLPPFSVAMPGLRNLDLSRNNLSTLPDLGNRVPALEVLNISDNALSELPANLIVCRNLWMVNAENNLIEGLPKDIGKWDGLKELRLQGNRICDAGRVAQATASLHGRKVDIGNQICR